MNHVKSYLTRSLIVFALITPSSLVNAQSPEIEFNNPNELNESQINSVDDFSDIDRNHWAFKAFKSLIEKYGVLIGYPDGTFRGTEKMSRYEFAAGMNQALEKINQSIKDELRGKLSDEDLNTLRRLETEFLPELTVLRNRVDNLEARAAELESNQFSTTTKLTGQAILSLNGGTQSDANNPNTTFFSRTRLNLETSFTGKDYLLTQLQAGTGNGNNDAAGFLQREEGSFRDGLIEFGENLTRENLELLAFPLDDLEVDLDDLGLGLSQIESVDEIRDTLAANIASQNLQAGATEEEALQIRENIRQSLVDAVNTSREISSFLQTNSTLDYAISRGSGLELNRLSYSFPVSDDLRVSVFPQGYISDYVDRNSYANNDATNFSTYGLVNNQLLLANDLPGAGAAVSWNPGKSPFTLRAAYRSQQEDIVNSTIVDNENNQGIFEDPNLGVVELEFSPSKTSAIRFQYSGGTQSSEEYDVIGANLEVALGKKLGIFGRFGYAFNFPGDIKPSSWSTGIVLRELFAQSDLFGISVGQPLIFQSNDSLIGSFDSTQTNFEAFYRLKVNDNISVSPIVQLITDPGNTQSDTIFTGTLRTVFSF
ncbi:iron uptake porin [Rivularia sp. UHCC 0363]|uniref:iron uptake porin n=1 Tax=Rivularia sp. UHCC 0363 TaxID=3110244 RepID=UPI002B21219B|nr:iron uptake porin [Rivularia sp. UHCC 0363]MEA5597124.1 iron uptake porin [Rivularia sp. UHCC 0363]